MESAKGFATMPCLPSWALCPSSGHISLQMHLCRTSVETVLPPWVGSGLLLRGALWPGPPLCRAGRTTLPCLTPVQSWGGLSVAWLWLLCGSGMGPSLGSLQVWSGDVPPRWPLASSSQGYSLSPVGLTGSQRPAEQQADPRCQTQLQIQYREMERPAPHTGHKRDCQSAVSHLVCHIPVGLLCHWPSSPQYQVCAHYGWGN